MLGDKWGLGRVLGSIDDVRLLGDAVLSQCRYITHWPFAPEREDVGLIVMMPKHTEELAPPALNG